MLYVSTALFTLLCGWFGISMMRRSLRRSRHQHWRKLPFPDSWKQVLHKNIAAYDSFPDDLRSELHELIHIFLNEKSFEGCAGLEVTKEMEVTIAAQACLLLLRHPSTLYRRLRSILIYPSAYVAGKKGVFGQQQDPSVRLGESWHSGVVVLSWDDVQHGGRDFKDGHNVTLHEFAHQLDQEDGAADGAPILEQRTNYVSWARVLSNEYKTIQKKTRKGRPSVLRSYGATNPAEFFAVATETFFEKPRQLHARHPELYKELHGYYHLNPLEWNAGHTKKDPLS